MIEKVSLSALDMPALLVSIEASIADFQTEHGEQAPFVRDAGGRYTLAELIKAWASVRELLDERERKT